MQGSVWKVPLAFLLVALLIWWLGPSTERPLTEYENVVAKELLSRFPEADPLLIRRVACRFGEAALVLDQRKQSLSLQCLDEFGADALEIERTSPDGMNQLIAVLKLPIRPKKLALGYWRQYVIDQASKGTLTPFVSKLETLAPRQIDIASQTPAALPLLLRDPEPEVLSALETHRSRAWELLSLIDFIHHPQDALRVARAIDQHGELILEIHERYGLPFALLLVGTEERPDETATICDLLKHAMAVLEDRTVALTLVVSNLEGIRTALRQGTTREQLLQSIDDFATLRDSPVAAELTAEYPQLLRLLSERWNDERIGLMVLRRGGPMAADLIEQLYGGELALRRAAMVAVAYAGSSAEHVLRVYGRDARFQQFLRRAQEEGLLRVGENPPHIVYAFVAIEKQKNADTLLESYGNSPRLREQIARDTFPQPEEFQWLPGYLAYRTGKDFVQGYRVSRGEAIWALVDGGEAIFAVVTAGGSFATKGSTEAVRTVARKTARRFLTWLNARNSDLPTQDIEAALEQALQDKGNSGTALTSTGSSLKPNPSIDTSDKTLPPAGSEGLNWRDQIQSVTALSESLSNALGGLRDNRKQIETVITQLRGQDAQVQVDPSLQASLDRLPKTTMLELLADTNAQITYGRALRQSRPVATQYRLHLWTAGSAVLQERPAPKRGTNVQPASQMVHHRALKPGDFELSLLSEVLR